MDTDSLIPVMAHSVSRMILPVLRGFASLAHCLVWIIIRPGGLGSWDKAESDLSRAVGARVAARRVARSPNPLEGDQDGKEMTTNISPEWFSR